MLHLRSTLTLVALAVAQISCAQLEPAPGGPSIASANRPPTGSSLSSPVSERSASERTAASFSALRGSVPPGAGTPSAGSAAVTAQNASEDATPRLIRGNDQVLAPRKPAAPVNGPSSTFKFDEAPVQEVVKVILGDLLKLDYVIHPPLAGSITFATNREVPADQALQLLETALQANGLTLARDTRGTYHVGKSDVLKGVVPAVRQAGGTEPLPAGSGAIVVPLQFIGAAEMATILRPIMPPDAIIRVDSLRNVLVLAGSRSQAEGWLDMVSTFDVDLLKGMSVGVFPLKYASTKEVETALRLLTTGAAPPSPPNPASNAPSPASGLGTTEIPAFFGAVRIMPIERINSLLVVTPRVAYLDEARLWIERLDRPSSNSTEPQLFVYPVQNGSAKHLASVMSGLFGVDNKNASQATGSSTGVAPGLSTSTASSSGFAGTFTAGTTSTGTALPGNLGSFGYTGGGQSNGAQPGVSSSNLIRGVRLVADEINNAVLIYAPAAEYQRIETTLKRLDVPPTQVLIEASIIEVTLNDDLQYGLQWFFTDKSRNGLTGTGVFSSVANGVLGGAQAGFSYTLRNSLGNVRAVLNALAEKSLVKVISSPSLMVLDNHLASIAVGNQQPIQAGQTVSTGGNVSTNIQYKDTGVSLAVTPSVNAGNMVTMQINQAVTDVGQIDTATGQRTFLQRQIASKVAVRSGETLVLGGLIRDNVISGKSGLPILHDIPVVGNLFGNTTVTTDRTELLVVITPRVVRSDVETRELSQELRDRMKGLSGLPSPLKPSASEVQQITETPAVSPPPISPVPVESTTQ